MNQHGQEGGLRPLTGKVTDVLSLPLIIPTLAGTPALSERVTEEGFYDHWGQALL